MMHTVIPATIAHLRISLIGVLLAALIGIPLGAFLKRTPKAADAVLGVVDAIQTVPTLAMFSFLMVALGLNDSTVIAAIVLYALLPILRNTYTGIIGVDPGIVRAGRGIGMTDFQLFYQVELPLALPVIISGMRLAFISALGITTTGVLVGASGLGMLVWRGVQTRNTAMMLSGAIPVSVLALLSNYLLAQLEKTLQRREQRRKNNKTPKEKNGNHAAV